MKAKQLHYKLEPKHLPFIRDSIDFAAMLQIGRMLNAFEMAVTNVREEIDRMPYHKMSQAAAYMGRLATNSAELVALLKPHFELHEHFAHLGEMFNGTDREVPTVRLRTLTLPEFRLYSSDPEIGRELRSRDIPGMQILFPLSPFHEAAAFKTEDDIKYQVDRYAIQYPKRRIEEQVLQVVCSLALDFSIGAEMFIKGCAKKMKLRDPDRSARGAAVATAA